MCHGLQMFDAYCLQSTLQESAKVLHLIFLFFWIPTHPNDSPFHWVVIAIKFSVYYLVRIISIGVERNQYQDNLQGQEFLHIYFEQVHVPGIQIQVPEFLAGKPSEQIYFYEEIPGKFFSLAFLHRNKLVHCFSLPGIPVPASEFPVHVPVPNKYARIPVPANYPGTGSAQPL